MKFYGALVFLAAAASTEAFAPSSMNAREVVTSLNAKKNMSRQDFFSVAIASSVASAAFFQPEVAEARGRATLEYAYDRYYPRLEAGGQFYANDLKKAIERNDWAAIKAATAEPPKRTKQDKAKADGGIAERAAQAGGFSNARVIAAVSIGCSY